MTRPDAGAAAAPMKGDGYYNAHSRIQGSAIACALPVWEHAVEGVPLADPVTIVDYGSSEGRNSLVPVSRALEILEARGANFGTDGAGADVIHADLPGNDFASLLAEVADSPQSYRRGRDRVKTSTVAGSFFDQLIPENSVTLGWCANAVHWLSAVPCSLEASVFATLAADSDRTQWAATAASDWERFLRARAAEMREGAELVVQSSGPGEDGLCGCEPLYRVADDALIELVDDGILRDEERHRICLPSYFRSDTEYRSAFGHPDIAPYLSLEEFSVGQMDDPYAAELSATGNAGAYATSWTEFLRAFTEGVFFGPGCLPERSPVQAASVADAFYEAVRRRIAGGPTGFPILWRVVSLRVVRRSVS